MIQEGQCGTFNPLLLECLLDISDSLAEEFKAASVNTKNEKEMRNIAEEILRYEEMEGSNRTLYYLDQERAKNRFFSSLSKEIQFEYTFTPSLLTLTEWGARKLGLDEPDTGTAEE